jgi:hypothetical protein
LQGKAKKKEKREGGGGEGKREEGREGGRKGGKERRTEGGKKGGRKTGRKEEREEGKVRLLFHLGGCPEVGEWVAIEHLQDMQTTMSQRQDGAHCMKEQRRNRNRQAEAL